jgi:hypothetical protein
MQLRSVASWYHAISVAMEQWLAGIMPFQWSCSSGPHILLSLLKLISRTETQPLQHTDYFADTLTFLVMAVFPEVTP